MARYYKKFILFIIPLFFIFIGYDVSALNFSSMSIRTAYWYDGGDLYDDGFVTTNPRELPQYVPTSTKGPVSLRLLQWRLTTPSNLSVGRYRISFNVSFSSLNGNDINNFTDINKFEEYGAGTSYDNSVSSNLTLIDYRISVVDSLTFKFEYTFDLKSASFNFFSGIIKWGPNYYDDKFVVNGLSETGTTPTGNSNLSYSISYASIEILNNQEIIDNQDKNTQEIIDNQDKNTQDIIDNQDKNNQEIIDNQNQNMLTCVNKTLTKNDITWTSGIYMEDGNIAGSSSWVHSNKIYIKSNETYSFTNLVSGDIWISNKILFFQDEFGNYISGLNNTLQNGTFTTPKNARYVVINNQLSLKDNFTLTGEFCTNKLDNINDSLTDDNVDSDVGTGFFDNFNDNDFGLSEIITIPLNTITSLTSKTCQPLSIPIPKTGKNVSLPCMTQVYQENIPSIFSIWQIVSFGIIAYFVSVDIFHLVKGFKDPDSDKVEVLDL